MYADSNVLASTSSWRLLIAALVSGGDEKACKQNSVMSLDIIVEYE